MFYLLQFLVLLCFVLNGCDRSTSDTSASESTTASTESATNKADSLKTPDYPGTYTGVLYCADCEGIAITLSLTYDNNFTLTTSNLGKKETKEETKTGFYSYQKHGAIITLIGIPAPNRYFAGENELYLLDLEGNRVSGELADKYILRKK